MDKNDADYRERLYQMFLPEVEEIDRLCMLRTSVHIAPHYEDGLDQQLAAAALYGLAKRLNLKVAKIEPESEEEYSLRRSLRGKFDKSLTEQISRMSPDQVKKELAEKYGISEERLKEFKQDIRGMIDFYRSWKASEPDEPSEADDPDYLEESYTRETFVPAQSNRVTKIEALFKIDSEEGRYATYCRAHTQDGAYSDTVFYWDKNHDKINEPVFDSDLVFELNTLLDSQEGHRAFLEKVVGHASWIKGCDSTDEINGLIALLELEFEKRSKN